MANAIRVKRGVAANLATLASGNSLSAGELYLITDQSRLSVGLSANTHAPHALLSEVQAKQDTLVSGTNIKTINGSSLLGAGNITISGGGGGLTVMPVTIDFGTVPVRSKTFSIADSGALVGDKYLVQANPDSDEYEMDDISCSAYCAVAGTILVIAHADPGPVTGTRKIFYAKV